MPSRRDFLAAIPALGAGAAFARGADDAEMGASARGGSCGATQPLELGWQFALDPQSTFSPATIGRSASDWQTDRPEKLDQLFSGSDIVISTVKSEALLDQKILVDAAKRANVKRFIPSDFGIACVPGVVDVHDEAKSHLMK